MGAAQNQSTTFSRSYAWAGFLLGFAMAGFFDGILLHQILQWHHLLSAIEADPFRDVRVQVLADGAFHALMYLLMAIGFWKLWQTRNEFGTSRADRYLFAYFLLGFGIWHIADSIFSHWLFGIHRVRPQSDHPLFWDLLFLFVLGLVPTLLGWWLRRGDTPGGHHRARAAVLALMVFTAAVCAAVPWNNTMP